MNDNIFTLLLIPFLVVTMMWIGNYLRKKLAKPKYKNGEQKPGIFYKFLLILFTMIAIFCAVVMVSGLVISEVEMAIAFSVLTLIFSVTVAILKRAYNISYHENNNYFILKVNKKEYQVFYENISDWQPAYNEIRILDASRLDSEYVRVNISIFKPVILLRKIAEMTFDGKFYHLDPIDPSDPNRENEIVNYLVNNNYGYLIEDYRGKLNKSNF